MKKTLFIILSLFLLTACGSKYNVDVNLTPEEVEEINEDIKAITVEIENYDNPDDSVPVLNIIHLARAYEDLGNLGKAIDIYEEVLGDGHSSRAVIHNLGRLYEKVGEYEKAVEQYQRLIDEYFDSKYLYDITWVYIDAGERKLAEKYFNAWQLEFKKTDEQTQQAIKKLREEEESDS